MLEFLGRGSAFAPENNNAYFIDGGDLVLIDCSMNTLQRAIALCRSLQELRRIYVLVTHTHSDHISGIGMLIHYAYFMLGVPVTIAASSDEVAADLRYLCEHLDGCEPASFDIADAASLKWVKAVIPTSHVAALEGRCFGFHLDVQGCDIVYTGDTNTLDPFLPYITPDTVLYSEISAVFSPVHLYIGSAIDRLKALSDSGTKIYLMHIDIEDEILQAIEGTDISLAPLGKF